MPIRSAFARFASAGRAFAKRAFWLRVSRLQALVEAWLGMFVMLFITNSFSRTLTNDTLGNIVFATCCAAGGWVALRARLAREKRRKSILGEEAMTGVFQGLLALMGVLLPLTLMNRVEVFTRSNIGDETSAIFLACSGLAFYGSRAVIWLLIYWNGLRRRSLMWSLTNAHLNVVVFAAMCVAVILTLYTLLGEPAPDIYQQLPPMPRFLGHLLSTLLPAIGIFVIVTITSLAFLLPPSAIFSFFYSRKLTNRLRDLIQAAQRFRAGDYAARVPVQGADEIAQLQSDFNTMAETLQTTLQELSSTLQNLREEQARVKEVLHSRRELVASVSHELRTPVATLRGYLDAALDDPKPSAERTLQGDLEVMRRETMRLQTLIEDLFTLSRAELQGLSLEMRPVDVRSLINERVAALAPLAWQSGRVEVIADVPCDLPLASADPTRLEQVLVNLLRNAIRYTPPGGIVAVIAQPQDNHLRIDVRDTGQGIAAEDLPHVWERFYRGSCHGSSRGSSTENSTSSGAGLGLALVKELTEAMGGAACVESQPGQGSCFTITLQTVP